VRIVVYSLSASNCIGKEPPSRIWSVWGSHQCSNTKASWHKHFGAVSWSQKFTTFWGPAVAWRAVAWRGVAWPCCATLIPSTTFNFNYYIIILLLYYYIYYYVIFQAPHFTFYSKHHI
jgi:hypothetical protein